MKGLKPLLAATLGAWVTAWTAVAMAAAPAASPVVNAPAGSVMGVREGGAEVFQAIPYALPPVGERRWRPPAPMPRWTGVRKVQAMGVGLHAAAHGGLRSPWPIDVGALAAWLL